MLKIHETTRAEDGTIGAVYLRVMGRELELVAEDGAAFVLPDSALARVMGRYGAPIEEGTRLSEVASLDLAGGARLRHVRHLARFDVIAKDWLVYEADGEAPVCALANTVARALSHLARAAAPDSGS